MKQIERRERPEPELRNGYVNTAFSIIDRLIEESKFSDSRDNAFNCMAREAWSNTAIFSFGLSMVFEKVQTDEQERSVVAAMFSGTGEPNETLVDWMFEYLNEKLEAGISKDDKATFAGYATRLSSGHVGMRRLAKKLSK